MLDPRCEALLRPWYGVRMKDGLCVVCRNQLPIRKLRYCSKPCADWFAENHFWGMARTAAYKRLVFNIATRSGCCSRCGEPEAPFGLPGDAEYPAYLRTRLEVDHIKPINGGARSTTCANHQDNLRVVCHSCHLVLTAEQRAAGLIGAGAPIWR